MGMRIDPEAVKFLRQSIGNMFGHADGVVFCWGCTTEIELPTNRHKYQSDGWYSLYRQTLHRLDLHTEHCPVGKAVKLLNELEGEGEAE